MAEKVSAAQVDGGVRKAKNGRYYVKLKKGGSRMLSDEDAKRLRAALRGKSKPASKPNPKPKPKARRASSSSSKKPDSKPRRRVKKYLADLL